MQDYRINVSLPLTICKQGASPDNDCFTLLVLPVGHIFDSAKSSTLKENLRNSDNSCRCFTLWHISHYLRGAMFFMAPYKDAVSFQQGFANLKSPDATCK